MNNKVPVTAAFGRAVRLGDLDLVYVEHPKNEQAHPAKADVVERTFSYRTSLR